MYGQFTTEWISILFPAIVFVLAAWWLSRPRVAAYANTLTQTNGNVSSTPIVITVLCAALVLRLILAASVSGYSVDIGCFKAWSNLAWENGLFNLYRAAEETNFFLDYPPGYMFILYLLGGFAKLTGLNMGSGVGTVFIKLPAILMDLGVAYLLFRLARKHLSESSAIWILVLAAFNPAMFVNSAMWGQVDVLTALLLMAGIWALMENKLEWACAWYALALLCKPLVVLCFPVFAVYIFRSRDWKRILRCALVGFGLFVIGVTPFMTSDGFFWFVKLYGGSVGTYPYAAMNTFNVMALLGGGWKEISAPFLGLDYQIWGYIGILTAMAGSIYITIRAKNKLGPLMGCILIMTSVYMLSHSMHERYLYMIIPMLLMAVAYTGDRIAYWLFAGFSGTLAVGQAYVLYLNFQEKYWIPSTDPISLIGSVINIAMFGMMVIWACRSMIKCTPIKTIALFGRDKPLRNQESNASMEETDMQFGEVRPFQHMAPSEWTLANQNKPFRFTRVDYLLLALMTLLYTGLTLYRLGGMNNPETHWNSGSGAQAIVLDLGEPMPNGRLYVYEGLGWGDYTIYKGDSPDGPWNEAGKLKVESVFHWKYFEWWAMDGQYMQIYLSTPNVEVKELAVIPYDSKVAVPVTLVTSASAQLANPEQLPNLLDEQDAVEYTPSFWTSTYFDEIYHARTAYEHLHQIEPYESTHPPLGKVMISWGIALFGMNPFGWRFMGAMMGVLMIPALYVLAKMFFKETRWAFLTTMLFNVDFMHYAQTRIATIDSFPLLFIILMFLFMFRFSQVSDRKKEWLMLLLSGISFGLACASKWIGIYGGGGLAVLFTIFMVEKTQKQPKGSQFRYVLQTGLWCVLSFILLPVTIYVASYIPFMQVEGPGHDLAAVWRYQLHMFNYHKGVTQDHPFKSAWWSWPLVLRPLWMYMGEGLQTGWKASIVTMGNPLLWWSGVPAVLGSVWIAWKQRDKRILTIIVAYLFQYVPWMFVSRPIFIYHYFACVPFFIICIVYCMQYLVDHGKLNIKLCWAYLGVAAALFALFFPVLSAIPIPMTVDAVLKWFSSWTF